MQHITLVPMPFRDYKSAKVARADYDADKDFIIKTLGFPEKPINKSQCIAEGFKVMLRFDNLRKIAVI